MSSPLSSVLRTSGKGLHNLSNISISSLDPWGGDTLGIRDLRDAIRELARLGFKGACSEYGAPALTQTSPTAFRLRALFPIRPLALLSPDHGTA